MEVKGFLLEFRKSESKKASIYRCHSDFLLPTNAARKKFRRSDVWVKFTEITSLIAVSATPPEIKNPRLFQMLDQKKKYLDFEV